LSQSCCRAKTVIAATDGGRELDQRRIFGALRIAAPMAGSAKQSGSAMPPLHGFDAIASRNGDSLAPSAMTKLGGGADD